jgi:hypothetical protein
MFFSLISPLSIWGGRGFLFDSNCSFCRRKKAALPKYRGVRQFLQCLITHHVLSGPSIHWLRLIENHVSIIGIYHLKMAVCKPSASSLSLTSIPKILTPKFHHYLWCSVLLCWPPTYPINLSWDSEQASSMNCYQNDASRMMSTTIFSLWFKSIHLFHARQFLWTSGLRTWRVCLVGNVPPVKKLNSPSLCTHPESLKKPKTSRFPHGCSQLCSKMNRIRLGILNMGASRFSFYEFRAAWLLPPNPAAIPQRSDQEMPLKSAKFRLFVQRTKSRPFTIDPHEVNLILLWFGVRLCLI